MDFALRISALVLALSVVALAEWYVRRSRATRWREYLFLLACATFGGAFGVSVDQVTARIAPEYFWIGKGIDAGKDFWPQVIELGFQAGFVAGAAIGGLLLVANSISKARPGLTMRRLSHFVVYPIACGLLVAVFGAFVIPIWDPLNFSEQLIRALKNEELGRLLTVWGIHLGLYTGGVVGTCVALFLVWHARGNTNRNASRNHPRSP